MSFRRNEENQMEKTNSTTIEQAKEKLGEMLPPASMALEPFDVSLLGKNYFGSCPLCGSAGVLRLLSKGCSFFCCDRHRTCWSSSYGPWDSWSFQSLAEWRVNLFTLEFGGFVIVHPLHGGWWATEKNFSEEERAELAATDAALQGKLDLLRTEGRGEEWRREQAAEPYEQFPKERWELLTEEKASQFLKDVEDEARFRKIVEDSGWKEDVIWDERFPPGISVWTGKPLNDTELKDQERYESGKDAAVLPEDDEFFASLPQ
jgi:hypothetical protein